MYTTTKIEYSDGHLEALEIEPPPLLLLPTVIAAFPTATAHKQLPTCNLRRLWVYLWRFHFPSLLFSVTNSPITIASLHHHCNPLFSTKNGKNQASGTSLLCLFEPSFPISGGGFQFQVMKLDQPIVFNFRTNISSGEVLKQKAFKHADSE